jgi:hypothetical protein
MSPEYQDEYGVKHYKNDRLGIRDTKVPSNYHFFPNDTSKTVKVGWFGEGMHEVEQIGETSVITWYREHPIGGDFILFSEGDSYIHSIHKVHLKK